MNEVSCFKVICTAGSLKSGQIVTIKLDMVLDIATLKNLLGKKDVILFATHGHVVITNPKNFIQSGNEQDRVEVASLFIGVSQREDIALWIIIASAIAGVILLTLLFVVLVKAGFFKRTTKEELEQLKKEMELSAGANHNEKEQEDE
ncbi:hypothetical protein Zmor_023672 [Zophobas morio]|uniref:Uncharacterized protein n=1 Tax=Zophobas morio TaxID=2755281 RepID=A0AA38I0D8_9CUCU|nr:hypothetical protein Zmor_023672 [Zophobas morio]